MASVTVFRLDTDSETDVRVIGEVKRALAELNVRRDELTRGWRSIWDALFGLHRGPDDGA